MTIEKPWAARQRRNVASATARATRAKIEFLQRFVASAMRRRRAGVYTKRATLPDVSFHASPAGALPRLYGSPIVM